MLAILGITSIGVLLVILAAVSFVFFWNSNNISYNPCSFNVYKDDYRRFIIIGLLHSLGIAILTTLQLLSHIFPDTVEQNLHGSIQIMSSISTIVYYHLLVNTYKYRFLQVRDLGHIDYRYAYFLELFCIIAHVFIFSYTLLLFQAELEYPLGMYSKDRMFVDPNTGWTINEFVSVWYFIIGIAFLMLLMDLFRITRSSYRTYHILHDFEDTTQYHFRKFISQNIEPHYVNDLITLFIPAVYLIARGSPVMHLNGWNVFAKCLLIIHPVVFIIIYMLQIELATRNSDKNDMECRCCVCRKKSMSAKNDSRLIRLKVLGPGVRAADSVEKGGAAAEDGQPTETTPSARTEEVKEL